MTKRSGFTLVELLVVLFIIVLLVAVGLPRVRDYGKRNGLRTAAQEIKSQILYAQALARTPDRKGATKYVFAANFSGLNYCLTTNASPTVCVAPPPANVIATIPTNNMIVYAVGDINSVVKPPTLLTSGVSKYGASCPTDTFYTIAFQVPSGQMILPSASCLSPSNIGVLQIKYSNDATATNYGYAKINIDFVSGDVGIQSCVKGSPSDTCN